MIVFIVDRSSCSCKNSTVVVSNKEYYVKQEKKNGGDGETADDKAGDKAGG